ncbi:MAG: penicillin acylase family protein [Caulobacteraceae bacterium]
MDDFAAINGASFRMVVDVGDWDNSRIINSPGQSGDPASPHYDDLFRYGPRAGTCRCCGPPRARGGASQVIVLTPEG